MFRDINGAPLERNYLTEVAGGKVSSARAVTAFGYSFNAPTASPAVLAWGLNTAYAFQSSAAAWELVSDSANDAAAGTGARSVVLSLLDANFAEVTQVVVPNGVTPVAIPGTYLRFNGATVITSGSVGTNVGNITIRTVAGSVPQGYVEAGFGAAHQALFTVPAGKVWMFQNILTSAAVIGNAAAGCRMLPKLRFENGTTFIGLPQHLTSNGPVFTTLPIPFAVPEKVSIYWDIDLVSLANCGVALGATGILRNA